MRLPLPRTTTITPSIRTLASSAKPKPRPQSRFGAGHSLDHFLQRSRALSLYRQILRSTTRIADANTRKETREMARVEFERNRGVTDITQIRYLISTGKTQWGGVERYIDGL